MIDDILIFDDILTQEEQDILLKFSIDNKNNFDSIKNIVRGQAKINDINSYPGKVLMIKLDDKIFTKNLKIYDIIHSIETKISNKIGFDFLHNSRIKINLLEPLGREYNPLELIHCDLIEQHYVIVYYINDSDGDTHIYNNPKGNTAAEYMNLYLNTNIDFNSFELIKSVTPKKGRAVLFNGKYAHCATYPTNGDRFVVNINFMGKEPKKNKSFI